MSDFSALNAAVTGLQSHRKRIDVISENIANINTPGYHRQVTNLTSIATGRQGLFSGRPGEHGGVEARVIRRFDNLLDSRAKREQSRAGSLQAQATAMTQLEDRIGPLSEGLAGRLQQLWNAFDDVANDPGDLAVRSVAIGSATAVAEELNHEAAIIDEAHRDATSAAQYTVDRINELSANIAELDRNIIAGSSTQQEPHGLIDLRDRLASELSAFVDIQVTYRPHGELTISVNGHNLVADGRAQRIELAPTPDASLAPLGYDRLEVTNPSGRVLNITGGSLHGTLAVANDLVPEQHRALDGIATSLLTSVNAAHQAGSGLDGSTGNSLFDPAGTTAGTFAVSADVLGNPQKIAASDGSGALDNSVALSLASLGTDQNGPSAVHADMLAVLGNRVRSLTDRADAAEAGSARAEAAHQAAVGVSLDEELADLVTAQRAYEASARMVNAIDEMLDTLVNRTGLVGR